MAISFIGQASGLASASLSGISPQAGDYILVWAYKTSTTAPTLASGYISLQAPSGNSTAARLAYRVSDGTETTTGTFTNAGALQVVVYRGVSRIGANTSTTNVAASSTTIPALTLTDTVDNTSWVVTFAGSRQSTSQGTPSGLTNRGTKTGTTADTEIADTNAGVTTFSSTSSANGSSATSASAVLELVAVGPAISTLTDDFNDNSTNSTKWPSAFTSAATYSETGGQLAITLAGTTAGTNYAGYISGNYNLTGGTAYTKVVTAPNQATASDAVVQVGIDGANLLRWVEENGTLYAQYIINSVKNNAGTLTYTGNEALYAWWSIREGAGNGLSGSAGTTYWDTSADGSTWSNQFSIANPIAVTALSVNLTGGTFQSETSPGTVVFDNFNVPGGTIITKTQSSVARVANIITKTQSTVARIQNNVTKTQPSVSRIQNTITKTQSAVSRVANNRTLTQSATAHITGGSTKTQTATARIQRNLTTTQSTVGRIATNRTITQSAIARIQNSFTKTQTAVSRIANNPTKTQSSVARIQRNLTTTQSTVARISGPITKSQSSISRIANNPTKTQSAVARVATNVTKTQSAVASVVQGSTFGDTSDGTGTSTSTSASKIANSSTPSSSGVVQTLTAHVFVTTTAVMRGVIYADSSGAPGSLLAQTDSQTISNSTDQSITFNFTGGNQISITSGTPYWIGVYWQAPSSAGTLSWRRGSTLNAADKSSDNSSGPASTFGTPSTINGPLALYVTYATAVTKTQSAIARIANNVTKTQSSIARVATTVTKTQTSVSRIANSLTKTQSATARIANGPTKTQSAIARIANNLTKTQSAVSRVSNNFTKTQSAISRVSNSLTKTQSAIAHIIGASTKTQSAVARVATTVTKTQTSIARVANNKTKTQGLIARVSNNFTKTQTSISRVANTLTKTQSATARLATIIDSTTDFEGLGYAGSQRKVAHNSAGRIFTAYRKHDGSNIYQPWLSYSDNGGSTWTNVQVASISTDHQRVPSIFVDTNDTIHYVWYGKDPSNTGTDQRQIKYSKSTDNGATWSSWISVGGDVSGYTSSTLWQEHPAIIADPANSNNLYVVWEGRDSVNTTSQAVKFSKSTNNGNTWSAWANIGPKGSRPDIAITSDGTIHVAFYSSQGTASSVQQIQHVTSTNGGTSWSSADIIGDTAFDSRMPSLIADGTSLHAVWRAPDATYSTPQIQYAKYSGGSWSSILAISPHNGLYQFFPQLALLNNATPTVVWFETSNSSGYTSESPTTGNLEISQLISGSWTSATAITAGGTDLFANIDRQYKRIMFSTNATSPYTIEFLNFQFTTIVTKTQTAVSRISNIVTKTQSATARIQRILTATQSAKARIAQGVTKTQSAVSRVANNRTITQTAVARIQRGLTKIQTAVANIANARTKTQSSVSRIAFNPTKTQPAISRIQNSHTKTQSATATITQNGAQTKTQSATARIQRVVTFTQAAVARIQSPLSKTQSSIARISQGYAKTQAATARIASVVTKTQSSIARISKNTTKTQSAISRIAINSAKTQSATARVTGVVTKIQTATAKIAVNKSTTQSAIARISYSTTKTQSSRARVASSVNKTQTSIASVALSVSHTQTAKARIISTIGEKHVIIGDQWTDGVAYYLKEGIWVQAELYYLDNSVWIASV